MTWNEKYKRLIIIWVASKLFPFASIRYKNLSNFWLIIAFSNGVNFVTARQKISRNTLLNRISLVASHHYDVNYSVINETDSLQTFPTFRMGFHRFGLGLRLIVLQILNRVSLQYFDFTIVPLARNNLIGGGYPLMAHEYLAIRKQRLHNF